MSPALLAALLLTASSTARAACERSRSAGDAGAVVAACAQLVDEAETALKDPNIGGAGYMKANDKLTLAADVLSDLHQKVWGPSNTPTAYARLRGDNVLAEQMDRQSGRIREIFSPTGGTAQDAPSPPAETLMSAGLNAVKGAGPGGPSGAAEQRMEKAGDTYAAKGSVTQAKAAYEQAAQLSPKDPEPFLRLAALSEKQGDLAAEKGYIARALAADPSSKAALIMRGHEDELERAGKAARRKDGFGAPKDAGAAGGGAAAEAGMIAVPKDLSADRASALAALSPARSPALPFIQKAEQKRALGDGSSALLAATQAIDSDRRNAAAWTIRADLDNDAKNYAAAVADASQALKLRPDDAQALRARAYAEYELGNYQAALADILKATEIDPANGTGWLYRAMIEEKLGDLEAAKRDYQKAVALDPALKPLAEEAFERLGLGRKATASGSEPSRRALRTVLRGGIALSLLLLLLALVGGEAAKRLTTRPSPSDEATVLEEPAAELGPGSLLDGHYRVEGVLGRGGMGVVYAARDETLDRRVAIKRLAIDGGATSEDLERFLREARLVARLKHPNIGEIYNVVERPERLLVFEFVDGQPLDRLLRARGRLPPKEAAAVVDDVAAALACAHEQKIIHRDLKPSNVMVARDGRCKVMDFGIAHQSSSGATFTRTSASGTPPYMAPEQALGSTSRASDLFALGVMAYELLEGTRPYEGPDYLEQKLQRQYRPIEGPLKAFFDAAFEPDPTKRHANAPAFASEFRRALLI